MNDIAKNIKVMDEIIENVYKFRYSEEYVTSKNEVKDSLSIGHHFFSAQSKKKLQTLRLKSMKLKIYRTSILPVILYGWKS